jgi:hypothetical protein
MTETLDEILEATAAWAKEQLAENGEMTIAAVIGYQRETDVIIYHAVQMSEHGKAILAASAALSLHATGCDRYAFVSEVWISALAMGQDVEPRNAPDMRHALLVAACDSGAAIQRLYLVEKDGAAVTLTLLKTEDSRKPGETVGGRWVTLLAPDFDPTGRGRPFSTPGGSG